jgi:hypothetical protein
MPPNLSFHFNKAVAETLRDYPQLRDTTVFVNAAEHPHVNSPLTMHGQNNAIAKTASYVDNIRKSLKTSQANGSSYAVSTFEQNGGYAVVLGAKKIPVMDEHPLTHIVGKSFVFDHEVGHILSKRFGKKTVNECTADAFAALRHIQKFGKDTSFLRHISWFRAHGLLAYNHKIHFTSPVIDRIIFDSQHQDFSKLSPQQTLERAVKYADQYTPNEKNILKARQAHKGFDNQSGEKLFQRLKNLATTCLATPDKFSFYIGARVLNPFLEPSGKTINGETLSLVRLREFQNLRAEITDRAKSFGLRVAPVPPSPRI